MTKYSAYPDMVDSGDQWFKYIPSHWVYEKLGFELVRNDGGVWGDTFDDSGTIVLRSTDVAVDGVWRINEPARRALSERERQEARLKLGDLLVTKSSGSTLHLGKVALVDEQVAELNACFSNFMQRLRLRQPDCPRFFWYFLNSNVAREQINYFGNSTTGLANISGSILSAICVAVPPGKEQARIAQFLDHEVTQIDRLIEKQQRLIELLDEKRQAVISHAVTKGLNPNAPMEGSGVSWLGEVPRNWRVVPLKLLICPETSISYGIVQPGDHVRDGVPFIQTYNLTAEKISREDLQRTDPDIAAKYPRTNLKEGDILLGIRASIGAVMVVPKELEDINLSRGIARIAPASAILSDFLAMYLKSEPVKSYWELWQQGSTYSVISIEVVKNLAVLVPPLEEQRAITDDIVKSIDQIDRLNDRVTRVIRLLQERRSALISAAVTGKIDVRDWQSPKSANETEEREEKLLEAAEQQAGYG